MPKGSTISRNVRLGVTPKNPWTVYTVSRKKLTYLKNASRLRFVAMLRMSSARRFHGVFTRSSISATL